MRALELVLLLGDVALLLGLAIAPPQWRRWLPFAGVIAVGLAVLQVGVEGYRWQMVPAYALSVVLLLAALAARGRPGKSSGLRRLGGGLAFIIGVFALGVAGVLPAMLPVFSFPEPSGPYGIGTVTYYWVDASRPELFAPQEGVHRELMVQIWYPAEKNRIAARAPYVDAISFAPVMRLVHMPPFLFDHLHLVRTNAQPGVPVVGGDAKFPVVVFSTGRGGYRQSSTFEVEELVSRGYVVVGIDHPYTATDVVFPDGRHVELDARIVASKAEGHETPFVLAVLDALGEDAAFVLDQLAGLDAHDESGILTGRLDLAHAGIFGTSLGGITTAEACRLDPRYKACLILDVDMPPDVVASGLTAPTMWISRAPELMRQEGWTEAAITQLQATMRSVFMRKPADGYLVRVPGMFHTDMTDLPLIIPPPLSGLLGAVGPGDPVRTHQIINAYSLAFFDKYLKGTPSPLLDGGTAEFPDVGFEKRP